MLCLNSRHKPSEAGWCQPIIQGPPVPAPLVQTGPLFPCYFKSAFLKPLRCCAGPHLSATRLTLTRSLPSGCRRPCDTPHFPPGLRVTPLSPQASPFPTSQSPVSFTSCLPTPQPPPTTPPPAGNVSPHVSLSHQPSLTQLLPFLAPVLGSWDANPADELQPQALLQPNTSQFPTKSVW